MAMTPSEFEAVEAVVLAADLPDGCAPEEVSRMTDGRITGYRCLADVAEGRCDVAVGRGGRYRRRIGGRGGWGWTVAGKRYGEVEVGFARSAWGVPAYTPDAMPVLYDGPEDALEASFDAARACLAWLDNG